MWLWENGQSRKIAEIEYCSYDYAWSPDERQVVASISPIEPCHSYAWLIDLKLKGAQPLFPKQDSRSAITVFGFSPSGSQLLFKMGDHLALLDLGNMVSTPLGLPFRIIRGHWINENSLLIVYNDQLGEPFVLGILDLTSLQLAELVNLTSIPSIGGDIILDERISPDRHWLAFVTAKERWDLISELCLMQLD